MSLGNMTSQTALPWMQLSTWTGSGQAVHLWTLKCEYIACLHHLYGVLLAYREVNSIFQTSAPVTSRAQNAMIAYKRGPSWNATVRETASIVYYWFNNMRYF